MPKKKKIHYGFYVSPGSWLAKKLDTVEGKSVKFLQIIEDYYNGKFATESEKSIDEQIKYQKLLKLKIENWQGLKELNLIQEEKLAILVGEKELENPTFQAGEWDPNNYGPCKICGHEHAVNPPHVCKNLNCKCKLQ